MTNPIKLGDLFQAVTRDLVNHRQVLNQADGYNQNHGDNMVQTFQTITRSLQAKQGKSDSVALSYAAKKLAQTTSSKSGQLYAQSLAQAAAQFKGKSVDSRGAMDLLQTLIGGGQAQPAAAGGARGRRRAGRSSCGRGPRGRELRTWPKFWS